MATVTVRTDDETDEALDALTRDGRSRSEAVREAILLAYRQASAARLGDEATAAGTDPDDLAEIRAIREELDAPGAW